MHDDLIDVDGTIGLVHEHPNIRLMLVQPSHCRRPQPIEELAKGLPDRVTLAVDVSHTAGLILAGLLPQPLLQGADILTFNTHKTLPGPNKGVIAFADRNHPLAHTMWETICPQLQSNSHAECLPGLVIALEEIANFGCAYAEQVVANARTLAQVLDRNGVNVLGMEYGGTKTHQVHVHLGTAEVANKAANERLPMWHPHELRTHPRDRRRIRAAPGHPGLNPSRITEVGFAKLGICSPKRCDGPPTPAGSARTWLICWRTIRCSRFSLASTSRLTASRWRACSAKCCASPRRGGLARGAPRHGRPITP